MKGDPFRCEVPESVNCYIAMRDGVAHIYQDQAAFERGEPLDWPYPDLRTFLDDQNLMYAFISDGPLWVSFHVWISMCRYIIKLIQPVSM